MMRYLIVLVLVFSMLGGVSAQDSPPPGYLDSCNQVPLLYELFGPNCLNPVRWSLDGFCPVDAVIFYVSDRGVGNVRGVVAGYSWDWSLNRYVYYVRTREPSGGFGGAFALVLVERVVSCQIT